ncbi:MAG: response regulator [Candidatus Glassbacteria bacterium]|nr:response regulator [Candidatus Glassbacteria bacterium]
MSYNILIIDDSKTIRKVIAKTIDMAQVPIGQLFEAANGREGLEVLGREWIDLVLVDINMPVMGGVEMVESMDADGLLATVPVVIVSTEGSQTRIEELSAKGVRAYIRKPFTPEKLKQVIAEILEERNE